MHKIYGFTGKGWGLLLLLLTTLLGGGRAQAQSGPYGNEWVVPSQQYYKVRVTRDGLYRLDYQYLTQAGLSGIDPSRLQLWRRGREVAAYQGGTRNVFDANTYLEFFGQRNDGQLDGDLYKTAAEQPHQLYSFYTDTAAYFLTYPGAAAPAARRMAELAAAGGTPQPWRLTTVTRLETVQVGETPHGDTYLPWVESGEGYFSILLGGAVRTPHYTPADSLLRAVVPAGSGPAPRVEVCVVGGRNAPHNIEVLVLDSTTATVTYRSLGRLIFSNYGFKVGRYALRRSEIGADGKFTIRLSGSAGGGTNSTGDYFRRAYVRVVAPQANRWLGPRRSLFFANDSLLGGPATFEVDSIPASVVGYDVQDPWNVQRVAPAAAQTLGPLGRRFVFPGATAASTHRLLLADAQRPLVPLAARRVRFRAINAAAVNFAIVSHRQLFGPGMDGTTPVPNAARAYAGYRASAAGGGYDTLLVTAAQLYDQFHYGERSWLALRHFGRWLAAAAPANPNRYLLLLGKGIGYSEPLIQGSNQSNINTFTTTRALGERGLDLVPTSSRSVSDNMITADFQTDDYVAKLRTGRLTAITPQQVLNYLGKLRTHEALGPEPWRKNVLHLVGGYTPSETADFRAVMDRAKVRTERPYFGGHVSTEFRVTPNSLPVSINIATYLNNGISVLNYFGHGSNNTFALEFGVPSDPANNYNNRDKYPVLMLNGCAGNQTFTPYATIVEDYLFADRKGAIGSLGESGYSYAAPLAVALDTLTKLLYNDAQWYGKPVVAVHDEAVRRLQRLPLFSDDIGAEQLLCTGWQGDPALALFAPARPDFIASAATLSVTPVPGQPGPVKASSTSFVLNVGVANPAKITFDSVEIRVTRRYASGRPPVVYPLFTRRQAWGRDTTYALTLTNTVAEAGLSTFEVALDPNNRVPEVSETNNTAQLDYTFLQGGLTVVNPTEFAIVTTAQPRLVVQSNDRNGTTRGYDFELDSVPTFNSGALLRAPLITASLVAEWRPALPAVAPRDSVVWYWRARFHTPAAGEDGSWATASFRVIPGSPSGWSQSHYGQFQRTTRTGVDVRSPTGAWAFVQNRVPLVLRTRGGGVPRSPATFESLTGAGIFLQSVGSPPSVSGCGVNSPNLLVAVYEPNGLRPVAMPAAYQRCGVGPNYFYYFSARDTIAGALDTLDNLNYSPARQQQLASFLAVVPPGAYVALVSANRLRYSRLPASLKATMQALLGSQLITQLADGEPLALLGQKLTATSGRLVHETGPDRSLPIPAHSQAIELRDTLQQRVTAGRVVSPRIGPAKDWLDLYSTIRLGTGFRTLKVVAIDSLGRESTPLPNVTAAVQPLAAILAAQYPYLRLELALGDTVTRVPPQLRQWLVTYRGVPEGVVRRDSVPAASYAPATLVQQATSVGIISFPVKFQNVSDVAFASPLKMRVKLRNTATNNADRNFVITVNTALAAGATATIPVSVDVRGLFGTFAAEVFVNPRLQPEQSYANNELLLDPFTVIDNNVPPTLDVAVDGRHILNGELVSSEPTIRIQLKDEDKVRHITDPSFLTVFLQGPGQPLTPVNLTGANVTFNVNNTNGSEATLEFQPGSTAPLPDGVYTLRVQARDPSGASAGTTEFQVKFEVVNASTITNVYPYPNPMMSKTQFVFTVTGHELPRNMKIQIMTLTGRVVREIFMSELGPLHIGNNLTPYAWDGTDTYGDRLANGTYLYRVALDDPGSQFSRRDSAGDKAFKNDWGKLVLMR